MWRWVDARGIGQLDNGQYMNELGRYHVYYWVTENKKLNGTFTRLSLLCLRNLTTSYFGVH
jgi:hypothetical protein